MEEEEEDSKSEGSNCVSVTWRAIYAGSTTSGVSSVRLLCRSRQLGSQSSPAFCA